MDDFPRVVDSFTPEQHQLRPAGDVSSPESCLRAPHPHHSVAGRAHRPGSGGPAYAVGTAHVGLGCVALFVECCRGLYCARVLSPACRRTVVQRVADGPVAASGDQQLHHLDVIVLGREVQRRHTFSV